ncbi:phage integrase [Candidatus Koribacter versatilis Ellin345]|uniref:Phage integrase n=1 Tax=Koribacter versatilis (strain Ellin345) TaxID=204669 RepID=Q1ILV0_KORVE|nr:site-specific integrase [Candidatus Koribacter versatilis]ABF42150.1 phage integrase [Candidatus Koribacter versatilis Ellin345]
MHPATDIQHTLGHIECPACEGTKNQIMMGQYLGEQFFPEAAAVWLRNRKSISESTKKDYRDHIDHLSTFFGQMRLKDVHIGHVHTYQRSRQEAIRSSKRHLATRHGDRRLNTDGASRINHELSCLGQVLRMAGLWEELRKFYEPLPLPKDSAGMALAEEEERYLFEVAKSRPRWMVAYCCALISRNTTAGPGEIRHLRLGDIELDTPAGNFLRIEEGVKNEFRKRPVPLNNDALKAVRFLLDRATQRLGAWRPEHFLLPHRAHEKGSQPDPTRPMGSWKKAHYAMCEEAGKKFPRLAHLRLYDYRHTAVTDLLEDPAVSFTTIEHMAGHRLNSNTKRKYDHLRNSALRVAADVLNRNHAGVTSEIEPPRPRPRGVRVQALAVQANEF